MSFISDAKDYLDKIATEIESVLSAANITLRVEKQHYLRQSDVGVLPFISVILDRIEPGAYVIGRGYCPIEIYYAITLLEKYNQDKVFTDLPYIEEALLNMEEKYDITGGTIVSENIAYEEVGNVVIQGSQIVYSINMNSNVQ